MTVCSVALVRETQMAITPKELGYTNTPWPLTFEEFKALAEKNAHDDQWLFGEGWDLIHQYPEYSDRMIVESLAKTFGKKEAAE